MIALFVIVALMNQNCRYLEALGLDSGLEFKVAMEEADKLGAKLVYGDISGQETMRRVSNTLTLPKIAQLLSASAPEVWDSHLAPAACGVLNEYHSSVRGDVRYIL